MSLHETVPCAVHPATGAWQPLPEEAKRVAAEVGTPAFVYNAEYIRRNFGDLRGRIEPETDILYSLKANPNPAIVDILRACGAGAEVSSRAELHTAINVGVDPTRIIFVGPSKTRTELVDCIQYRIFAIVAESLQELEAIDAEARAMGRSDAVRVMLRINPSFATAGSGLTMSGKPRQFGIDQEQVADLVAPLGDLSAIRIIGFHVYMGTRYLEADPLIENTEKILEMAGKLGETLGISLEAVDVGGGFGVPYFEDEAGLDLDTAARGINAAMSHFRGSHPGCQLMVELGRYLSAGSGALLTSVRYTKVSRGTKFAIADGGTNLHMAAVGTGGFAKRSFPVINLEDRASGSDGETTLTGPLCTPSDTIARKAAIGDVRPGDVLAVLCSGAYGPTASPTGFLSHGYPAEVLLDGGDLHIVRPADGVEDILDVYRLPGDRPVKPAPDTFDLAVRMSSADAHYGGDVVDGARILQLFGDAVTGLAARLDSDESLLQGWENVDFLAPVKPGDFLKIKATIVRKTRLRRHVQVEALRLIKARDPATSAVDPLHAPEPVACAKGTIVIPMPNRKEIRA